MLVRDPITQLVGQHDIYNPAYLDFGDASRSTGILATFGSVLDQKIMLKHYVGHGLMVRHPYQSPWWEVQNFSRDQMIPLLSGFAECKDDYILKQIFYATAKRFFFCQNLDLTTPAVILQMILGARLKWFYWFYPIGMAWHLIEILFNCYVVPFREQNQVICQTKQFKTGFIYRKLHPDYRKALNLYWGGWRNQSEFVTQIIDAKWD
jgi:hypothetical protein